MNFDFCWGFWFDLVALLDSIILCVVLNLCRV